MESAGRQDDSWSPQEDKLDAPISYNVYVEESQLPVTAAKKWQGCLFKQQCELEMKLGQREVFC